MQITNLQVPNDVERLRDATVMLAGRWPVAVMASVSTLKPASAVSGCADFKILRSFPVARTFLIGDLDEANDLDSSGRGLCRLCLQKGFSVPGIQRDRRRTARWLWIDGVKGHPESHRAGYA